MAIHPSSFQSRMDHNSPGGRITEHISLMELAQEQLLLAHKSKAGRSAVTVCGGHDHVLRQTVIALVEERELSEHANPGEATLQVLHGRVVLDAHDLSVTGAPGDLVIIPAVPHSLRAVEDSVVLLTVAKINIPHTQES